jgi:branched-chain amino acid transport system permease protein
LPRLRELSPLQAAALFGLLLLLLAAPLSGADWLIKLATRIVIFALAAAALDLALGLGGLVSFGHAAFLGLGAYVVGIAFLHGFEGSTFFGFMPPADIWRQMAIAIAVSAAFAAVTGWVCLRTRGVAFIMITLAFAQMLFYFFVSLRRYQGEDGIALWSRSDGVFLDLSSDVVFHLFALSWLLLFLLFASRLAHSRFGRVLRAARDNERRVRALGFPVLRFRLVAWVISAATTAVAGVLLANATWFVGPSYLSWPVSGQLIVMVVLGGMGTLWGPVLGAALFLLLEQFLPDLLDLIAAGAGEHWKLLLGPLLVLLALKVRRGVFGALGRLRLRRADATAMEPVGG